MRLSVTHSWQSEVAEQLQKENLIFDNDALSSSVQEATSKTPYNGMHFHRVVPGFMNQFDNHHNPRTEKQERQQLQLEQLQE